MFSLPPLGAHSSEQPRKSFSDMTRRSHVWNVDSSTSLVFRRLFQWAACLMGHSSFCQESRRLVLEGKTTVAYTGRNADPAHGLSIQESDSRYIFFPHSGVAWGPTVQVHNTGLLIKRWLINMYRNSNTSCVAHDNGSILWSM